MTIEVIETHAGQVEVIETHAGQVEVLEVPRAVVEVVEVPGAQTPGPPGATGDNGKEVELRVDGGYIQWRLDGQSWQNLISTSALKGAPGNKGDDGDDGKGWTGGSYDAGTGKVTFTSADGLGFATGDLRGTNGTDGTDGTMWFSEVAEPGMVPIARDDGMLDASWFAPYRVGVNDIGVAGTAGFGVGICPRPPADCTPMPGCTDVLSDNYGNYQFDDGSVCVWIPAFWLRVGSSQSPNYAQYGSNARDIRPRAAYPDAVTAAADSFYLHRAFINGGQEQAGFFRSKYLSSYNSGIASSIKGAKPVAASTVSGDQYGFADCTANGQAPTNNLGGAIEAAKSRGDKWHNSSVFEEAVLFEIAMAHAQAASSATYCAWYDDSDVTNYPKGNNATLKDVDDNSVTFESAEVTGYSYLAKTGSGNPFAKTTHNGQACGVTDVNGNYWRPLIGITCAATIKSIEGATNTNPVKITITDHGFETGDIAMTASNVGGMSEIASRVWRITKVDENSFTLDTADGTGFGTYTSGGAIIVGKFLMLKPEADINALTSETSGPNGHWSAEAQAALFEQFDPGFRTDYPNNFSQRLGNDAEQVFGWNGGEERRLTMALVPKPDGVSGSGTNLMGSDYAYQYVRHQLCVIAGGAGNSGSGAGVGCRSLYNPRGILAAFLSFAASRFL